MVFAAVTLVCRASAFALDPSLNVSQYAHTSWKISDGFTKGVLQAIAQGSDGYLWLGTEFGLVRFDGVSAVPWQPPAGQRLPGNNVQALLSARDGSLWIGTLSGLASWKDGKLTTYPEWAGHEVSSLLQDHEGVIWVGGFTSPAGAGLCSIRNARMDCYGGDGKLGRIVLGLYEDGSQNLWVGTSEGFWRWRPGPPQFFRASSDSAGIKGLAEDDEHSLLVGVKGGIRRFINGRSFEARPLPYAGLTAWVKQIFRDREGSLWIATSTHGLVHVHQGKVDTFSSSDGLSGDSVSAVLEDREGNIWVAANDGLDRFRAYSIPTISYKQGLGHTFAISALAASDDSVWIATAAGLDRWDRGTVSTYTASEGDSQQNGLFNSPPPHSLFEDSSGRIWVTTNQECGYLDHGRFVSISRYPGGYVRGIAEGPPGHLWLASAQRGLLEVFRSKVVQQRSWPGLGFEQNANALAIDPATNGLWLGFWKGGIAYFAANKIQASWSAAEGLGQGNVNDLRMDSRGTLWASTDGGLSRIRDGRISTLTSRNGLPCDAVLWSVEDHDHAVWLYMPCGLVRITAEDLDAWAINPKISIKTIALDASDGVWPHTWTRAFRPQVTMTRDGKIWFITSDGVSILDPHHLLINHVPPPVHIERIVADDKLFYPAAGLRLPARVHYLTIDYTALSFSVPEKVRFRYKLEGVDSGWREVINKREAQYTNPPPGRYMFRVIAANDSGVWNEQGDTLEFDILPAWYQTFWFRTLCTITLLLLLWLAYLLRVRHLKGQEKKLLDVVQTIPSFVWTALPDGSVDFANQHWEEFSGLSAEESAGSGWLQALHPEDRSRHEQKWRASVSSGDPFDIEVRFRRTNGEYRWFLVRAVAMRGPRGRIDKWYGTTTDIEDRKRAELLRAELAHFNRLSTMGELLASISHDLKQPIAASVLNAQTASRWLKHDPPNVNAASEMTDKIIKSSKLAGEIIDRLRSFYKKALPNREPLAVNEVVDEVIGMLRAEATRYGVSLRAELASNLPTVSGDRVQIQQVLMNLMLNGIEAMHETGGILTVTSQLTADGQVQLSIIDAGLGLPQVDAGRIFDPFFTTKPLGSGMGLAISKSIVESHGGRIWASVNGLRGAAFHFTLPVLATGSKV